MSDPHVYNGITQPIFTCIKAKSKAEHGTDYEPPDANSGTATTKIAWIGTVKVDFSFNHSAQTLTYSNLQKPSGLLESLVWNGIESTINECRGA